MSTTVPNIDKLMKFLNLLKIVWMESKLIKMQDDLHTKCNTWCKMLKPLTSSKQ